MTEDGIEANGLVPHRVVDDPTLQALVSDLRAIDGSRGLEPLPGWSDHWSRFWEFPFAIRAVRRFAEQRPQPLHILDNGSGMTPFPHWCERDGHSVVGLDIDEKRALEWPDRQLFPRLTFVAGDMNHLPFPDEVFDVVACISTLEHLEQPGRALEEMLRVLSPDGLIVLTTDILFDYTADNAADGLYLKELRDLLLERTDPLLPERSAAGELLTHRRMNRGIGVRGKLGRLRLRVTGNNDDVAIYGFAGTRK